MDYRGHRKQYHTTSPASSARQILIKKQNSQDFLCFSTVGIVHIVVAVVKEKSNCCCTERTVVVGESTFNNLVGSCERVHPETDRKTRAVIRLDQERLIEPL